MGDRVEIPVGSAARASSAASTSSAAPLGDVVWREAVFGRKWINLDSQARELSKTVALALQHKVEAEREAMKLEALAADLRANETALMNRASFAAQSAARIEE